MKLNEVASINGIGCHHLHRPILLGRRLLLALPGPLPSRCLRWLVYRIVGWQPATRSCHRPGRLELPLSCWSLRLITWLMEMVTLSMAYFSDCEIMIWPGGGLTSPPSSIISLSKSSGFWEMSSNSWGDVWAICWRKADNEFGSFLIIWRIWANWGELIREASIDGSRVDAAPVPPVAPVPGTWPGWGTGGAFGMPLIRYSTALSGLLKAALKASTTCYRVKPIFIRFWTDASYCSPTTRLFSAVDGPVDPVVEAPVPTAVDGTVGTGGTGAVLVFGISTGLGASLGGSGFYVTQRWYLDCDHYDHEVALLDSQRLQCLSIDCIFAFEHQLLGIHFECFLLFDFVFDVEDLHECLLTVSAASASTVNSSPFKVLIVIFMLSKIF